MNVQQKKDQLWEYITILVATKKITNDEAVTLMAGIESLVSAVRREEFECGMKSGQEVISKTLSILNRKT